MSELQCCVVFVMKDKDGREGCPKVATPDGQIFWLMHTGTEEECDKVTQGLLPIVKSLGQPFRIVKFNSRVDETAKWMGTGDV